MNACHRRPSKPCSPKIEPPVTAITPNRPDHLNTVPANPRRSISASHSRNGGCSAPSAYLVLPTIASSTWKCHLEIHRRMHPAWTTRLLLWRS
jgi:hypothetical protein